MTRATLFNRQTMRRLYFLSLLCLILFFSLISCTKEEDDCELSSQPITDESLVTSSADFTYNKHAFYRDKKGFELYSITGSCGGARTVDWSYTGDYRILGPSSPFLSAEFLTSGTLCGQLRGDGKVSAMACREVKVTRQNVWGRQSQKFPGGASVQGVTLRIGDIAYSGFGTSNTWYAFDTTSWQWQAKATVPNVINFSAFGGFVLSGSAYIVGNNSQVYRYSPTTDSWTLLGNFPVNVADYLQLGTVQRDKYNFTVLGETINGKGYFGMGINTRIWEFDPAGNTWTEKASFPVYGERWKHVFAYQGKLYIGKYWYSPITDTWTMNNIDFNVNNGYSADFVEIDGLMYGAANSKTVVYNGISVIEHTPRPRVSGEQYAPSGIISQGVAIGPIAIFPRTVTLTPQGFTSAIDQTLYYVKE